MNVRIEKNEAELFSGTKKVRTKFLLFVWNLYLRLTGKRVNLCRNTRLSTFTLQFSDSHPYVAQAQN